MRTFPISTIPRQKRVLDQAGKSTTVTTRVAPRTVKPERGPLAFYTPEQIEALARAIADGAHRDPDTPEVAQREQAARALDDGRDGELVRVAAWLRHTPACAGAS